MPISEEGMTNRNRDNAVAAQGTWNAMPRWIVVCARASFLFALPTIVWRIPPAVGVPLGTPQAWRDFQGFPGAGTEYAVGLSVAQLAA